LAQAVMLLQMSIQQGCMTFSGIFLTILGFRWAKYLPFYLGPTFILLHGGTSLKVPSRHLADDWDWESATIILRTFLLLRRRFINWATVARYSIWWNHYFTMKDWT